MSQEKKGCSCWEDKMQLIKDHMEKTGGIPKIDGQPNFSWRGFTYMLGGGDYSPVNATVDIKYRKLKRDGTPAKSMSKSEINLMFDFCPWCGRKLEKKDAKGETA